MRKTDRELLFDAFMALKAWSSIDIDDIAVTHEIRARLDELPPEPVAWLIAGSITQDKELAQCQSNTPLYSYPPC